MAKVKNKTIYSDDREYLKYLAEEFTFIGRDFRLDLNAGELTQFALKPKRAKKKHEKSERNKRAESAARRS